MVDDDDIMTDTTEVEAEGKGGPVERAPSQAAKGKVSHKTAKMIWFVCIAICVLAVAAVVVDMTLDPLKRRGEGNGAPVDNTPQPAKRDKPPLTEKQKLAGEFAQRAYKARQAREGSRAFDFVRVAIKEARTAADAGDKDPTSAEAWTAAWVAYYRARYALELFKFTWPYDPAKVPMVSEMDDVNALAQLEKEELESKEAPAHLAGSILFDRMDEELRKLERRMDQVVKAGNVKTGEYPDVKAARKKYETARDKRVKESFDQADLDYVNRPARTEDEPAPY